MPLVWSIYAPNEVFYVPQKIIRRKLPQSGSRDHLSLQPVRERLARAVREKGRDNVEGAADDDLCVICQDEPVDPVEVGRNIQQ